VLTALALAASVVSISAGSASAGNECVAPSAAVINVDHVQGQPGTFTASLKQSGTVTCSDWTVNVSSYKIPDTWNHQGWNETIMPQVEFAHRLLVFPAGQQEPVTQSFPVPTCGSFQTDAYTGPELKRLEWPAPMKGVKLAGTIHAVPASDNCQPPPPPPPPTPAVFHPKGHIVCGCKHHKDFVKFVLNNRHSKNGTHRSATVQYQWCLLGKTFATCATRNVKAGHRVVIHRSVPRGTKATLKFPGHKTIHKRATQVCKHHHTPTPPIGPPHTGQAHATFGKVVLGKA